MCRERFASLVEGRVGSLRSPVVRRRRLSQIMYIGTRKLGLLYYHAIKSGSIKSLKSVFNKRTNCYELRRTINDKIDWISHKYNPTQEEISAWKISFAAFSKSKSETESNKK